MDPLLLRQLTISAIVGAVVAYALFRFLRRPVKPPIKLKRREPAALPHQGYQFYGPSDSKPLPDIIVDPIPPGHEDKP